MIINRGQNQAQAIIPINDKVSKDFFKFKGTQSHEELKTGFSVFTAIEPAFLDLIGIIWQIVSL